MSARDHAFEHADIDEGNEPPLVGFLERTAARIDAAAAGFRSCGIEFVGEVPPALDAASHERQAAALDAEAAKKRAAKEKREAKKKAGEVEAELAEAELEAARARLDAALLDVEAPPLAEGDIDRPEARAQEHARRAAEARAAYVQGFEVDSRAKAAWAARKVAEARTEEEEAKRVQALEVARAKRRHERRKEFFEAKLEAWAKAQPREFVKCPECGGAGDDPDPGSGPAGARECPRCKGEGKVPAATAARLPEAGVRLELRRAEIGGVVVQDEARLCAEFLESLGALEALEAGVVRQAYVLVPSVAKAYLDARPGLDLAGAARLPRETVEKLTIVRL